jgi:hypothetical protein
MVKGEYFVRFGFKGISDIIGIMPGGRFLAVECKVPGRKPTPEQERFIGEISRKGGAALVVHDAAELMKMLDKLVVGECPKSKNPAQPQKGGLA